MGVRGVCSQVNRFQMAKVGIGLFAVTSVIFSSFLIARVYSGNFPKSLDAKWLRDLKDHFVAHGKYGTILLLIGSVTTSILFTYIYFKRKAKRDLELFSAAWNGDTDRVRSLLERGVDVDQRSQFTLSTTPLMDAAENGHRGVVQLLLDKGAKVDAPEDCRSFGTPLIYAAKNGHLKVVRLLLARGADMTAVDLAGRTPLLIAAAAGHVEVVRLLLAQEAPAKNHEYFFAFSAEKDHEDPVKWLLEKGVETDEIINPVFGFKYEISSIFKIVYYQWKMEKTAKQADYANILKLFIEHGIKLPKDYEQYPKIVELIEERKAALDTAIKDDTFPENLVNIIAAYSGINPDFISDKTKERKTALDKAKERKIALDKAKERKIALDKAIEDGRITEDFANLVSLGIVQMK